MESQAENFQLQAMLACWAKLSQRDEPDVYHPLLCHMIDVAVVAGRMWSSVLSPGKRSEIAKGLGLGENQDSAGVWCAFLAGLHDLGKASPDFQLQVSRVRAEVTKRLRGIGLPVKTGRSPKTSPHGTITAATLPSILTETFGMDGQVAKRVAKVTGGHHGVFPTSSEVQGVRTNARGNHKWDAHRLVLVDQLAEILGVPRNRTPGKIVIR